MSNLEIMWTKVDEAPALATYSLLPIVKAFVGAAGVSVTLKDISLAGRVRHVLANKAAAKRTMHMKAKYRKPWMIAQVPASRARYSCSSEDLGLSGGNSFRTILSTMWTIMPTMIASPPIRMRLDSPARAALVSRLTTGPPLAV